MLSEADLFNESRETFNKHLALIQTSERLDIHETSHYHNAVLAFDDRRHTSPWVVFEIDEDSGFIDNLFTFETEVEAIDNFLIRVNCHTI